MSVEQHLTFAIRPATADDLPACLGLDHTSVSEYVWQVEADQVPDGMTYNFRTVRLPRPMSILYPHEPEVTLQAWQLRDYFIIAEGEHGIYGYLSMHADRVYSIGWIRALVVDRPRRRLRVGSALLLHSQRWARMNGLRRITVETQTKNYPAISFLQRHGLTLCGFNDRYFLNQDIALFFTQSVR